uniref:Uncharacterized protein n=1 Tax=Mycena chlorophos TaxID=658473 RepID=A0ABQ0KYE7_MYCCL|nr:predicted protein [Mycena chlorophos]
MAPAAHSTECPPGHATQRLRHHLWIVAVELRCSCSGNDADQLCGPAPLVLQTTPFAAPKASLPNPRGRVGFRFAGLHLPRTPQHASQHASRALFEPSPPQGTSSMGSLWHLRAE